jgi:hypothetical protein
MKKLGGGAFGEIYKGKKILTLSNIKKTAYFGKVKERPQSLRASFSKAG